jgi:hypothetical protein
MNSPNFIQVLYLTQTTTPEKVVFTSAHKTSTFINKVVKTDI